MSDLNSQLNREWYEGELHRVGAPIVNEFIAAVRTPDLTAEDLSTLLGEAVRKAFAGGFQAGFTEASAITLTALEKGRADAEDS